MEEATVESKAANAADSVPADDGAEVSKAEPKVQDEDILGSTGGAPEADDATASAEGGGEAETDAPAYEPFAAPEGVTLDEAALQEFTSVASELGLKQEAAQKLVDIAVQMQQRQEQAILAQRTEWANELRNDPVLGGKNFDATAAAARRAVDYLGGDELRSALRNAGVGLLPPLVKAFATIGKQFVEDHAIVNPKSRVQSEPSREEVLYPGLAKK